MSPNRLVLALGFLLPISLIAAADSGSDAVKIYKKELGRVVARQKNYASKALDRDLRAAFDTYRAPWLNRGAPGAPKVIDYDFSGYADIYERWAEYDEEKGSLALAMAEVDGLKVAERLVATLLDVLAEIQRQDQALLSSKPKTRSVHDQAPGIVRYGAWLHRDMLVDALGKLRELHAVSYLGKTGWSKASRWDRGRKSVRARVALLDGLARTGSDMGEIMAESMLRAEEPQLRIAALEALHLMKQDPPTKVYLRTARDDDPCRSVREAARTLLAEPALKPSKDAPSFCGIKTESKRIILVLEASYQMVKPVDIEFMKEKSYYEWRAIAEKDRNWVSILDVLKTEVRALVNALAADTRFNLLLLNGGDQVTPFSARGMAVAGNSGKRRASAFVEEILAGGFAPQIQGLWEACRVAGAAPFGTALPEEPEADTIFLFSNGVPRGGQLLYGPAIVDDVRRRHRFLRIPIHTVRVDDAAEPAEEIMKGIAEATGGTYVRRTEP